MMSWITLAAAAAIVDWIAVARRNRILEYAAKPAVMIALIGAALVADVDPAAVRTWFVLALALSLAGDVFLMLERERFVAGLVSFLLGHLAYIAGLAISGIEAAAALGGLLAAGLAIWVVGRRIGDAVRLRHPALTLPVWAYIIVISVMLATALGTGNLRAIAGAGLFYLSDALLGWSRFVAPLRNGRLAVIVPYHLGQILLVLALPTL